MCGRFRTSVGRPLRTPLGHRPSSTSPCPRETRSEGQQAREAVTAWGFFTAEAAPPWGCPGICATSPAPRELTCPSEVTGLVHLALEELQPDDGIDDDHEEDEQGDVEQGEHGLEDGVEDHLQACSGGGRGAGGVISPHPRSLAHPPPPQTLGSLGGRGVGGGPRSGQGNSVGREKGPAGAPPATHWAPPTPGGGV